MMREKIVTDTKLRAKRCEICGQQVDPENPNMSLWVYQGPNKFMHKKCYLQWLEHDINERYKQEGGHWMKQHNKHRKIEGLF